MRRHRCDLWMIIWCPGCTCFYIRNSSMELTSQHYLECGKFLCLIFASKGACKVVEVLRAFPQPHTHQSFKIASHKAPHWIAQGTSVERGTLSRTNQQDKHLCGPLLCRKGTPLSQLKSMCGLSPLLFCSIQWIIFSNYAIKLKKTSKKSKNNPIIINIWVGGREVKITDARKLSLVQWNRQISNSMRTKCLKYSAFMVT